MSRNYSNVAVQTTLTSGINSSDATLAVGSVTGYPATNFTVILEPGTVKEELVTVASISGLSFIGCTRGVDGTPATTHSTGAVVVHGTSARDFREPNEHSDDTTAVHGITDTTALVTLTGTQTLTNKTLTAPTITSLAASAPALTGGGSWSGSPTITSPTITTPAITTPTITSGGSWSGSPTITSPTIANFSNATHTHTDAASGGTLSTGGSLFTLFQERTTTQTFSSGSFVTIAGGTLSYTSPSAWPTGATKLVLNCAVYDVGYDGAPNGLRRLTFRFLVDGSTSYPDSTGADMYVVANTTLGQLWSFSYSWVVPLPSTSASHSLAAQVQLPSDNGSIVRSQVWANCI